jgi:hypothetical protein
MTKTMSRLTVASEGALGLLAPSPQSASHLSVGLGGQRDREGMGCNIRYVTFACSSNSYSESAESER